ncbi:alginate O-acetyltransferase AlgX-related protein [Alteromonas flava]|uniref:alginate O-acetyltransferase AlgX-related protein n=1 Tax=Alteromonas flava TaxID=2048003 RepID=UPI000C2878E1|nr:hypothetical protein [Alteromonas flava]
MNAKFLVSTLFMTVLTVTGLITILRAPVNVQATYTEILNGTASKRIEDQLLAAIPYKQVVTDYWARFLFTVFNEGKAGVVIGEDGWLYSNEEFQWPNDSERNIVTNSQFVQNVVSRLKADNIEVVIILVPEKIAVYPEYIQQPSAHTTHQLHQRVLQKLQADELIFVDPLPHLLAAKINSPQEMFLRTDTHWTPAGAQVVAQHVAAELTHLQGSQKYSSSRAELTPYTGDLLTFIPADGNWLRKHIPLDQIPEVSSSLESDDFSDLFATPEPVFAALVGTSYSANATWNFHGYLQQAMAIEILNYANEGQGPFTPMQALLTDNELQSQAITTVFWEIPIRYFVQAPVDSSVKEN